MKNKPSIVVFEVNDNNRSKFEYGKYSPIEYFDLFCDFIESLGYNIESKSIINEIKINGHSFKVNTNNASYMSKNSYTREVNVRKPENRYITIEYGFNKIILKIHFNKEYDANKIKAKIDSVIKLKSDLIQNNIDSENIRLNNVTHISKQYINSGICNYAYNLNIHKNNIDLYSNGIIISFNSTGELIRIIVNKDEKIKDKSDILSIMNDLKLIPEHIYKIIEIVKNNKFNSEITEWIINNGSGSYDFKTLTYSKY